MKSKQIESFWPSISDLMSGLMMVFLFIAISFMLKINKQKEVIQTEKNALENLVSKYKNGKLDLYDSLVGEFGKDLELWGASIDKESLSIRFNEPEILFSRGSSEINQKFKKLLNDFFPRYIAILSSEKYIKEIQEIRIEGHTSSEWANWSSKMGSYHSNMALSQERTRKTLEYVMGLPESKRLEKFLIDKLTANGLSFSKNIIINGKEDAKASRRVEFKIRTKAEKYLDDMFRQVETNKRVQNKDTINKLNEDVNKKLSKELDK